MSLRVWTLALLALFHLSVLAKAVPPRKTSAHKPTAAGASATATAPAADPSLDQKMTADSLNVLPYAIGVKNECLVEALSASMLADRYRKTIENYLQFHATIEDVQGAHQKELDFLDNLELTKPDCYKSVANYHAVYQVYAGDGMTGSSLAYAQYELAFLAKSGHLVPISPRERNRLGGAWTDVDPKTHQSHMLGAYDCDSETIYYDPTLALFDLTATLLHELSHFGRNQLSAQIYKADFEGLTSREMVLIDEALALMQGGLYEVFVNMLITGRGNDSRASPGSDLTLFQPNGNLDVITKDLLRTKRGDSPIETSWVRWIPFVDISNHSAPYSIQSLRLDEIIAFSDQKGTNAYVKRLEAILNTTAQSYFPKAQFDTHKLAQMLKKSWGAAGFIDPFGENIQDASIFRPIGDGFLKPQISIRDAQNLFSEDVAKRVLTDDFAQHLSEFRRSVQDSFFSWKNYLCNMYQKDVADNQFEDYAGRHVPIPDNGPKAVNPGNRGSMPETPAKPGNRGSMPEIPAKPGNRGSMPEIPAKPEETGVSPSVPIRPCFRLNEGV